MLGLPFPFVPLYAFVMRFCEEPFGNAIVHV